MPISGNSIKTFRAALLLSVTNIFMVTAEPIS
jgi:hypothetical protein